MKPVPHSLAVGKCCRGKEIPKEAFQPVAGRSLEGWPEVFRCRKISGRRKM